MGAAAGYQHDAGILQGGAAAMAEPGQRGGGVGRHRQFSDPAGALGPLYEDASISATTGLPLSCHANLGSQAELAHCHGEEGSGLATPANRPY